MHGTAPRPAPLTYACKQDMKSCVTGFRVTFAPIAERTKSALFLQKMKRSVHAERLTPFFHSLLRELLAHPAVAEIVPGRRLDSEAGSRSDLTLTLIGATGLDQTKAAATARRVPYAIASMVGNSPGRAPPREV